MQSDLHVQIYFYLGSYIYIYKFTFYFFVNVCVLNHLC